MMAFPPTLDVLFLLFGGCIFHQLKRKLSYKILSTPESQKSHLFFAFRTCFCMSVITPSCQFLADFAAHKADFSAGADKPGLENQLCYVVTAWDGTYLLPKVHFLIWKTETSRTVRKIKCFNTWKHSNSACLVFWKSHKILALINLWILQKIFIESLLCARHCLSSSPL